MLIEADLHTHTCASTHAFSTIKENCRYASRYGLRGIAMTDHMTAMEDSPHEWHFHNMSCLPRAISGVYVLKGVELNVIDSEGNVDMKESLLKKMEWCVASMHRTVLDGSDRDANTRAYLKLCENPYIDVIGHPTTDAFPYDMEKCLKAFKEYGKLPEVNESSIVTKDGSRRNCIEMLKICKKYEIPVAVDTDAHYCELVGMVTESEKLIEELGFPIRLVENASWENIVERVRSRHPNINI